MTDTKSHAFAACLYDVKLSSTDDDAGSTSSTVNVLITGTSTARFSVSYWQRQYSGKPTDFSNATLLCYLKIARYVSLVFDEKRPLATVQQAENVLKAGGGTSDTEQFDRQLLAALFNFANGDPDYNELIDTNGDKVGDTPFLYGARERRGGPAQPGLHQGADRRAEGPARAHRPRPGLSELGRGEAACRFAPPDGSFQHGDGHGVAAMSSGLTSRTGQVMVGFENSRLVELGRQALRELWLFSERPS